MSGSANVRSLEALEDFHAALCGFVDGARDCLSTNQMQIRRAIDWVSREQPANLRRLIDQREAELKEMKTVLARKRLENATGGHRDLSEYQDAVRRAQRAIESAREKIDQCKRWTTLLQRSFDDYLAQSHGLAEIAENNPSPPVVAMRNIIDSIVKYLDTAPVRSVAAPTNLGAKSEGKIIHEADGESREAASDTQKPPRILGQDDGNLE